MSKQQHQHVHKTKVIRRNENNHLHYAQVRNHSNFPKCVIILSQGIETLETTVVPSLDAQ